MSKVVRIHEQGGPEVLRHRGPRGRGARARRNPRAYRGHRSQSLRSGISRWAVSGETEVPDAHGLRGLRHGRITRRRREGFQGWRTGVRAADVSTGRIRCVRRKRHRAGAQRDRGAARSELDRGGVNLDAVLHGDGHHRDHARDGRRLRDHSRGFEQRGARGDSARELGRRDANCRHAAQRQTRRHCSITARNT